MLVGERLERPAGHLVAKVDGRIESRDPGRKSEANSEVTSLELDIVAEDEEAAFWSSKNALAGVGEALRVELDVAGEIEADLRRGGDRGFDGEHGHAGGDALAGGLERYQLGRQFSEGR